MLGTKLYKGKYTNKEYADVAVECNKNGWTLEDKGNYYEVVEIPVHVPTVDEIKATLLKAVDNYLDTTVQERGYDNIAKCVTYEGDIDPIFNREGTAAKQWRSKVYRKCYDILDEVMNGLREIPTEEELINELPKIEWGVDE